MAPKTAAAYRPSPQKIAIDRSKIPDLLHPGEMKRADMELGSFVVWVDNTIAREKVLRPSWWANHVAQLKPGTPVTVMRRDMSMVLELRVIMSAPGMAKFVVMGEFDAKTDAPEVAELPPLDNPDAYEVKHTPATGYIVLFKANGQRISPIEKKFTEAEALAFANDHNKQANG